MLAFVANDQGIWFEDALKNQANKESNPRWCARVKKLKEHKPNEVEELVTKSLLCI